MRHWLTATLAGLVFTLILAGPVWVGTLWWSVHTHGPGAANFIPFLLPTIWPLVTFLTPFGWAGWVASTLALGFAAPRPLLTRTRSLQAVGAFAAVYVACWLPIFQLNLGAA